MNNTTNNGSQQTAGHNEQTNDGARQMTGHNKLTQMTGYNKQTADIAQLTNNGGGTTSQLTRHKNTVDRAGQCSTLQEMQEHSTTQRH